MINLTIDGESHSFPREWTASAVLAKLGHSDLASTRSSEPTGAWSARPSRWAES